MPQTVLITLTLAGADTGPFDLFSDADGFVNPFEVNVPKASLVAGYTSILVPSAATQIMVKSKGVCTNSVTLPIVGTLATTTTSTTSVPASTTTSTSTSLTSSSTTSSTSTSSTLAPCKCFMVQNTEAPTPPDTNYGTGAYTDCNGEPLLWVITSPLGRVFLCARNQVDIIVTSGNVSITPILPSDPLYVNCSC